MKKLFFVLLAVSVVGGCLMACGDDSESAENQRQEKHEVTACIDILDIKSKTEEEVASTLGDPIMSESSEFAPGAISNTYTDSTEILFVNDEPARITIYPPSGSNVEDGAALIGLSEEQSKTPSYDNSENYYWNDNSEFYKIIAFNDGNGEISYIYVITSEEYQ